MSGAVRWWGAVCAYVLVLFGLQPYLGLAVDAFKARWGVPAFERVMLVAALAFGAALLVLVQRLWRRAGFTERVMFAAVLGLYALGLALLEVPQERLHYAEYGVLAGLLYFALGRHQSRLVALLGAILVTTALGYLDEVLQGALWERRYFDWRDVQLNFQAAVLGTLAAVPTERVMRTGA
jgi:hypothetical protein